MNENFKISIQSKITSPYRVWEFTPFYKILAISGLFILFTGIMLSFWITLKWTYHHTTFAYYSKENNNLKKELDQRIDKLQEVMSSIHQYRQIESNLKIRYGIGGEEPLQIEMKMGTGGRLSAKEQFITDTDPLENKFLEINKMATTINLLTDQSFKNLELMSNYLNYQKDIWQHTPYILPTEGIINSNYGWRFHPIQKIRKPHKGVDIAGNKWTAVYASANGRVVKSYKSPSYGNLVVVDHGNGYITKYAHLARRMIKKGAFVKRYELLGYLGESGHTTGPHLHYEVHRDDTPKNPVNFILPAGILVD